MPFLLMSTDVKIWLLCETEIKIKKEKYNVKSKSVIRFFDVGFSLGAIFWSKWDYFQKLTRWSWQHAAQ